MAVVTSFLLADFALVLGALVLALVFWFRRRFGFWSDRGVPQLKPVFPFGDFTDAVLARESLGQRYAAIYDAFKGEPYCGAYVMAQPILVLRDPEIIKHVLVKDFASYNSHGMFTDETLDHFTGNLFMTHGPRWRFLRTKLSPTFTSGKMRYMFPVLDALSADLTNLLKTQIKRSPDVDVRELVARYATDVIVSVALGIDSHALQDPNSEFRAMGKLIFEPTLRLLLRNYAYMNAHPLVRLLRFPMADSNALHFIDEMVGETVSFRERTGTTRADFLQLLIQLKNEEHGGDGDSRPLSMKEVAAQVFVFFIAGYETSSNAATWTLLELARNQDAQSRLLAELDAVLEQSDGKVTYDVLQKLVYMEAAINEAMRVHPVIPVLLRSVTASSARLPGSDLLLERGQQLIIPVLGLHRDPSLFPEPLAYRPDRFLGDQKDSVKPFSYVPFGEGPRLCIVSAGMRFGMMQLKMSLVALLREHRVALPNQDVERMLEIEPHSFVHQTKHPLTLRFTARTPQSATVS